MSRELISIQLHYTVVVLSMKQCSGDPSAMQGLTHTTHLPARMPSFWCQSSSLGSGDFALTWEDRYQVVDECLYPWIAHG